MLSGSTFLNRAPANAQSGPCCLLPFLTPGALAARDSSLKMIASARRDRGAEARRSRFRPEEAAGFFRARLGSAPPGTSASSATQSLRSSGDDVLARLVREVVARVAGTTGRTRRESTFSHGVGLCAIDTNCNSVSVPRRPSFRPSQSSERTPRWSEMSCRTSGRWCTWPMTPAAR